MYIYYVYRNDGTHNSFYSFKAALTDGAIGKQGFKITKWMNNVESDVFISCEYREDFMSSTNQED